MGGEVALEVRPKVVSNWEKGLKGQGQNQVEAAWRALSLTPFQADALCTNLGFFSFCWHLANKVTFRRLPTLPVENVRHLTEPERASFNIYYPLFQLRAAPQAQGPSFPTQHNPLPY